MKDSPKWNLQKKKMSNEIPTRYLPRKAAPTDICVTSVELVPPNPVWTSLKWFPTIINCTMILPTRPMKYNTPRTYTDYRKDLVFSIKLIHTNWIIRTTRSLVLALLVGGYLSKSSLVNTRVACTGIIVAFSVGDW